MSEVHLQPYLVLPNGEIFLLSGNITIGRSAQNSILLDGPKVSRIHTHIYEIGGQFQVVDSQSRNGTYVNKQRIMGPVTLKRGDVIGVGGHIFTYQDPLAAEAAKSGSFTERTIEAMEKTLTWLVLLDIKDSTNLAFKHGVEGYACLVSAWFNACREIIEESGGAINKSTGDGLLAYWKDTEGNCAESVARALVELKQLQTTTEPSFRLVVHYGLVGIGGGAGLGEEPLSGPEVHLIFRAEKGLSQTSSDFAGTETAAWALEKWMQRTDLGHFSPKGFEGQYQLYQLDPIEVIET